MYRVELKAKPCELLGTFPNEFLMYRVELKAGGKSAPNMLMLKFLMYRVELKVKGGGRPLSGGDGVPNVPCGVERRLRLLAQKSFISEFLMYRVELKAILSASFPQAFRSS